MLQMQGVLPMKLTGLLTRFIASRLRCNVIDSASFTGIVYKDCGNCQDCVHIFKTMQEDPCWDCIEHGYDAYEKR